MLQQNSLFILKLLLSHNTMTIEELISKSNLSKRQIDYNLDNINDWLETNGFNKIMRKKEGRFYLNNNVNAILLNLSHEKFYYVLNEEERQALIYIYIYINQELVSMNHLMDLLEVSRGTVQNDLNKLRETLESEDLTIDYSRKEGYQIIGYEKDIQYYMMKLVVEMVTHDNITDKSAKLIEGEFTDLEKLKQDIMKAIEETDKTISENNLNIISYVYTFYKKRNESIKYNFMNVTLKKLNLDLTVYDEFSIAKEILKGRDTDFEYPCFLASLLLGYVSTVPNSNHVDYYQVQEVIDEIITNLKKSYAISLSNQNHVFSQLYAHIRPATYRLQFQYPMVNPLKEQIISKYRSIYIIIKEVIDVSVQSLQHNTSEDEIAYLTIHFATFLIDDVPDNEKNVNGIILCPGGVGVSALLYQELRKLFPYINFLESASISELENIIDDIDVIFSTVLIETSKPLFIVSPLMNNIERIKLVESYNRKIHNTNARGNIDLREIIKIIESYTDIIDKEGLIQELSNFISSNETTHVNVKRRQPKLSELINPNLIQLKVSATDWRDAIKKSAKPLLENEFVTSNYVDAMIQNTEENGPYIVIAKHVALPHARPEEGAIEAAIGITTLDKPIVFGNKANDPVKYIFCLSAVDNSTHLRGLSELVDLLDDKQFYKVLETASETSQVINYLKERSV